MPQPSFNTTRNCEPNDNMKGIYYIDYNFSFFPITLIMLSMGVCAPHASPCKYAMCTHTGAPLLHTFSGYIL